MKKIKLKIDKILEISVISLMSGIVLAILWQVISRYVFRSPSEYSDELSRFLLIWMGLLGATYATGMKYHIALDFFAKKYLQKKQKQIDIFIQVLILLFAISVMIIGGIRLVYITLSLGQISSSLQVPLGYVYSVLPLSGLLISFYSIYHISTSKTTK